MICIDPGKRYLAYAQFERDSLLAAKMIDRLEFKQLDRHQHVVVEEPWGVDKEKGVREADIRALVLAAGLYAGHFDTHRFVLASSCPKPARHAQALKRLSPAELAVLPKQKTHLKHVLCAVWIGLKELGRLT